MKSTIPTTMLFAFILLMMSGCKKEMPARIPEVPDNPVFPSTAVHPLDHVFADNLAAATQQYTITTDNGPGYVNGTQGFYAGFAAHAFRKADGSTATGPINITLVEAFNVGDMLLLNKQTVGNDNGQPRLLVSGGQFRLTAEQDGEPLHLAPGMSYMSVPIPGLPDADMALFSGRIQSDGTMMWDLWPNNMITPIDSATIDSIPLGGFSYSFPSDSLNWINCDYFYGSGEPLTAVQVTCPPTFTASNTMVWLVFPTLNSLTNLSSGSGSVFSTGGGYELPVGMDITVVALGQVDEQYYSSFTPAVVSQGMNMSITLAPTTLAQFAQDAGGL